MHDLARLVPQSVRFVPDEGDDHAVEVEEEHDKMETQFNERFLMHNVRKTLKTKDIEFLQIYIRSSQDIPSYERSTS